MKQYLLKPEYHQEYCVDSGDLSGCCLAGLLGTVIGMIETFQAITLFGAGDPKTMASGISKALATTVLGLGGDFTTLLHAIVSSQSKGIIHISKNRVQELLHAEGSVGLSANLLGKQECSGKHT